MKTEPLVNEDRQRTLYRRRLVGIILFIVGFVTSIAFFIVSGLMDDFDKGWNFVIAGLVIMGMLFISFLVIMIIRIRNPEYLFQTRMFKKQYEKAAKRSEKLGEEIFGERRKKSAGRGYDAATVPYTITGEPERNKESKYYCSYCGYKLNKKGKICPECGQRLSNM